MHSLYWNVSIENCIWLTDALYQHCLFVICSTADLCVIVSTLTNPHHHSWQHVTPALNMSSRPVSLVKNKQQTLVKNPL